MISFHQPRLALRAFSVAHEPTRSDLLEVIVVTFWGSFTFAFVTLPPFAAKYVNGSLQFPLIYTKRVHKFHERGFSTGTKEVRNASKDGVNRIPSFLPDACMKTSKALIWFHMFQGRIF